MHSPSTKKGFKIPWKKKNSQELAARNSASMSPPLSSSSKAKRSLFHGGSSDDKKKRKPSGEHGGRDNSPLEGVVPHDGVVISGSLEGRTTRRQGSLLELGKLGVLYL